MRLLTTDVSPPRYIICVPVQYLNNGWDRDMECMHGTNICDSKTFSQQILVV